MRSKRKRFAAGRMSLKAFAITMVMAFLLQETVLSVMAELPTVPEDLVTVIEGEQTESYDDDDDDILREMSTQQMAASKTSTPQMEASMTRTPQMAVSKSGTPQMAVSKTSTQQMAVSKTGTPQMAVSMTRTPQMAVSMTRTPQMAVSMTHTPQMAVSKTSTQQMAVSKTSTQQMAVGTTAGKTTAKFESKEPEAEEKINEKFPEKLKTTKTLEGMRTLPRTKPPESITTVGDTFPEETSTGSEPPTIVNTVGITPSIEDSKLTTAVRVPSRSAAMDESTESPKTNKRTNAIVELGTTNMVTSGYTLENLPMTTSETTTMDESLVTIGDVPTSHFITSSSLLPSTSASGSPSAATVSPLVSTSTLPSSSPSVSTSTLPSSSPSPSPSPSSSPSVVPSVLPSSSPSPSPLPATEALSTAIYISMMTSGAQDPRDRHTRETTTSSVEDKKCKTYTFQPNSYGDFIQNTDPAQEIFTRFEMSGRGIFGGDEWNKSLSIDAGDSFVRVDLRNELIPGELYEITRSWCYNDRCPESGKCPNLNISRGLQGMDVESFHFVEANTTSASFFWSLYSKAYTPDLNVTLNLTNEKQSPVERTVATIREGVYTTTGSFVLDQLASGAQYLVKFVLPNNGEEWGTSEIEFFTDPAMPEDLRFHQLNYNTVNLSWYQPYYSDSFSISYGPENSTHVTEDTYFILENLTQGISYNISVTAQTRNQSSVPENMVLRLEPPSLGLEVTEKFTTSVSTKMTTTENIEYVSIIVDGSPFHNFTNVHGERELNITSLTPGKAYPLKFMARIRDFVWKEFTTIFTNPLPPEILHVDNSDYSQLEVCWNPPSLGGYDSFYVQFGSSQRGSTLNEVNETHCYSQNVQPGAVYTVSVSTVSNRLQSVQATKTALARPAPPVIREVNKTTTNVTVAVSCPRENYFHHVKVAFCGRSDVDCSQSMLNCSSNKQEVLTEGDLTPGNRYTFKAVSVQDGDDDLRAESDVIYHRITTYPPPPTNLSVIKKSGLEIIIQWNSTCFTCNYSIEAVPHNRYLGIVSKHSICYDGIEFNEYRLCKYSLVITREQLHDITVKTSSWGEESLPGDSDTVFNISMPMATKHVTEIQLTPLAPSLLLVNFKPPEVPHEDISKYEIVYHGYRETSGELCPLREVTLAPDYPLPVNVTVKGGCHYEFSIKAFFGNKEGEDATETVNTTVGAPVAKDSVPRYPDRSTVTHRGFEVIFDPEMFSDDNGALEYFTVIVAEAPVDTRNASSTLPGWSESIRETPIPPFQILPKMQVTYSDDKRVSKRSVIISQPVMIGNESCGSTNERYCNGPLIGGRSYKYWFRGFTSVGFADTLPSQQVLLPKSQSSLIIIFLIIFVILFLIVIVLIGLLLRKCLRMDSKGDYQPAPTDSVILKSMTKNSSRAKYIRAIKLTEFCQDFHIMSAHSNFGYSQEFENLRRVGRKLTSYDAVLPENVSKNRYTNILPYDKTRVKLGSIDDELGSDYINANWIPGFSSPREYIACQGPLPGTADDMWRMVWEKNVSVIVMVTQLVEKGKVKCDQYWPEDHKPVYYGDIQVTMTQTTETESWNMKEFNLYKPYVDQRKKVKHFNYLSWPDHGVPENSESLLNFIEVVRQQSPKNGSPTIVHCSAGCGRTGTYICLDRLLQQIEEFDYVNILGTAAEMRAHRQHMVQTEQQYVFIHRCVLDILEEKGIAPKPSSIPMNGNTGGTPLFGVIV